MRELSHAKPYLHRVSPGIRHRQTGIRDVHVAQFHADIALRAEYVHAERGLSRARLADREDGQSAAAAFAAAIASLRQQSTPYHLAHGLLDYAEHLLGRGDAEGAAAAIEEARGIGTGLRFSFSSLRVGLSCESSFRKRR